MVGFMYFIYVLASEMAQKSYVGSTDDVERRLGEHNEGRGASTSKYRPWRILYTETFVTREEALEREKYLKSRSGRRFLKRVVFV